MSQKLLLSGRCRSVFLYIHLRSEGMFVIVCVAGLTRVMDLAPHWSTLRNPMIMRIYNDVILRFTTGHWSVHA